MGAEQSNQNSQNKEQPSNNIQEEEEKPKILEEHQQINNEIMKLSKSLYKKYGRMMNNEKLCNNLELVAVDKLNHINIFDLKKIVGNKLEDRVTINPIYLPRKEDKAKYEIGEVVSLAPCFVNNKLIISIPEDLSGKDMKKINIITDEVIDLLKDYKIKFKTKNEVNAQKGGDIKNIEKGLQAIYPNQELGKNIVITNKNTFDKRNNKPKENSFDKRNNSFQEKKRNNSFQEKKRKNSFQEKKRNNSFQEKKRNNSFQEKKRDNSFDKRNNKPKENSFNKRDNSFQEKKRNNSFQERKKNNSFNKRNNKPKENVNNIFTNIIKDTNKPKNKNIEEELEKVVSKNLQKTIKKETNKETNKEVEKKSGYTKENLCKLIARHYFVRGLIISAIVGVLHLRGKPGFCFQRINALQNGVFCLPPNYEDQLGKTYEETARFFKRYIYYFDFESCNNANGFYKKTNKDILKEIKQNTSELGKKYNNHISVMKLNYTNSLKQLKEIIEKLMNNSDLTNRDLLELCEKTKEIITEMFIRCQKNYILGVIAFLQLEHKVLKVDNETINNLIGALEG